MVTENVTSVLQLLDFEYSIMFVSKPSKAIMGEATKVIVGVVIKISNGWHKILARTLVNVQSIKCTKY